MGDIFNFDSLNEFDLFHIKYGRGALIVAIHKDDDGKIGSEKHASQLFNSMDRGVQGIKYPEYNEIVSIKELDGYVHIKLIMKKTGQPTSSVNPAFDCIIERTLPINQITLEVVQEVIRKPKETRSGMVA